MKPFIILAFVIGMATPATAQAVYYGWGDGWRHHHHHWRDWREPPREERYWSWHRRWRGCNPAVFPAGICDE
jgi:hypothetical protein